MARADYCQTMDIGQVLDAPLTDFEIIAENDIVSAKSWPSPLKRRFC